MPVSDLVRLGVSRLTSQQLASMALERDRAARQARQDGDHRAARAYQMEADALADLSAKA